MDEQIDIYCERLSPEFWAEPLNAATNIVFLIAAFFGYKFWQQDGAKRIDILMLIVICACVGIGSFLFHTFAVFWAMLADVIPIAIFIYSAIGIFLKRVANLSLFKTLIGLLLFFVFNMLLAKILPPSLLNGSVEYLPAFLALVGFAAYSKLREFVLASIVFFLSITFRSLDMQLCEATAGIGTHIFWHSLNGYLLYLVIRGLIIGSRK